LVQQVNTSPGPAGAQAISAKDMTDADRQAAIAANTHNDVGGPQDPAPADPSPDPSLIGGKFKSQEDLLAAYQALEKQNTQQNQAKPADPTATPADPAANPTDALAIKEAVTSATGDAGAFDAYTQEFAQNGKLADESYAALEAAGINREMVDFYIRGQQAVAADFTSQVFEATGGEEAYGQVTAWAAQNLTAAEQAAYNTAVNSGDAAQASLAATGLKARYDAANGSAPKLITGDATGAQATDVYTSFEEVARIMSSDDYKYNPGYRAKVDAKVKRSPI